MQFKGGKLKPLDQLMAPLIVNQGNGSHWKTIGIPIAFLKNTF